MHRIYGYPVSSQPYIYIYMYSVYGYCYNIGYIVDYTYAGLSCNQIQLGKCLQVRIRSDAKLDFETPISLHVTQASRPPPFVERERERVGSISTVCLSTINLREAQCDYCCFHSRSDTYKCVFFLL